MARWYDKHDELGMYLNLMPEMNSEQRDELVKGIVGIIKKNKPDLLTDLVLEFPLDLFAAAGTTKIPICGLCSTGFNILITT